jgi:plasmid stabilization system protein ParE
MPVYELQIEAKAYDDLKEIVDYLAKHSLQALKNFRDHLDKQLNLLRTMPLIGSNPRDPKLRRKRLSFFDLG